MGWFTTLFALFPFLVYAGSAMISPPFSSSQIKFWSENVQNKMPTPILKKLSPLTQNDYIFYASMISNNVGFSADSRFCSLAKLSCSSTLGNVKPLDDAYNTYNNDNNRQASTLGNVKPLDDAYNTYNNDNSRQASIFGVQKKGDPFSFFRISILKNGNSIHLPNLQDSLPDRAFLPPQIATKISLNIKEITKLFPGSTKETIENTLFYCNAAAIKGEVKRCPKSLEEMIDFSKSALGGKRLISLTSKSTQGSNTELTIKNVKKFNADKTVACHEAFLPFAAYFCHSLSSTSLYSVDLVEPKTGAPVNTLVAICHMDTSPWPKNHVAFEILKFRPGQGEACHWFTQIDLAWILDTE